MGSVAALLPTFAIGVMLDVLPVRAVLIFIGVSLAGLAVSAWWRGRRALRPVPAT